MLNKYQYNYLKEMRKIYEGIYKLPFVQYVVWAGCISNHASLRSLLQEYTWNSVEPDTDMFIYMQTLETSKCSRNRGCTGIIVQHFMGHSDSKEFYWGLQKMHM